MTTRSDSSIATGISALAIFAIALRLVSNAAQAGEQDPSEVEARHRCELVDEVGAFE
jgi:hypothetical protein